MALTKEKKTDIVKKIGDIIKSARSVVFVNFHGLSVADANEIRRSFRERDMGYVVAKKTLVRRALADAQILGEVPTLNGELAIAYLPAQAGPPAQAGDNDPVAPASAIAVFAKKFKNSIAILGGVFEGRFTDKDEMEMIAAIPPISVLCGQFVNVINSPIQGLVVALDQIAKERN